MSDETHIPAGDGDDALAAEYVLGVLDAEERTRAAERIAREPDFARRVADWEERLSSLNEEFADEAPPPSVKAALDRRLFVEPAASGSDGAGLWSSLAFWRGLAGVALAGLVALAVFAFGGTERPVTGEQLVAALEPVDSDTQFVALYDPARDELRITRIAGDKPADRDFELWLIVGDNAPVSLGLVGGEGEKAPSIASPLRDDFTEGVTLAVSVEPLGGSPTGIATGPVVALGPVKKI